ncbi:LANO_0D04632g1_1 [Lachancea nothofagi CBS 11611]|uniref:LANO_0D04632g1_1 n=1 Tax=Lachancea nothofagi CBS 11611 TaxID=1266666 RepID=A0A1G4JGC5_9SACH|nr:LANO_0D04632g1_1 [Lachancea nothofagi CBS 11611]
MGDITSPLPQSAGYAVVVGLGFVFAFGMILTTYMLKRYQKEIVTAEEFATAGRTVKTGLIAAAVVSSWTWAATLLQSTSMVYRVGISGGYYYGAGACFQVIAFATLAIKAKQRAPNAHTFLEIINARYGKIAHITFLFFALATNILVTAMLLTGGSAVVSDLTGMDTIAACFLLPVGVIIYTLFGGIKATFLTDYVHTIVIIVIILTFAFTVYATDESLGSPSKVYDLVRAAAAAHPIEGNAGGEYLTMRSKSGGIFFVINLVGNFGTVFLDNGYWNKAISASPAASLPGYVLGGVSWFAIPTLISTAMGLACVALESNPKFPTYPNRLTADQVSAGLVLPSAAVTILGKGGAVAALIMVFMAVTSAMSAELISVSSIFTYDIYRQYIDPKASGKKLILSSHATCIIFGFTMAGFSVGLVKSNCGMGYLYELMGIIISAAVLPAALTLFWSKQNLVAVVVSPILGTGLAIMSWLICTKKQFNTINMTTTFEDDPMLTGNVVALLSPAIFIPILTYAFKPQNFDWELMKTITRAEETEEIEAAEGISEDNNVQRESDSANSIDKEKLQAVKSVVSVAQDIPSEKIDAMEEEEARQLAKAGKLGTYLTCFFAVALLVVWPMPMYGSNYIFSKRFFTGWVVVLIIWMFFTGFAVCIYPLWEGREGLFTTFRGVYWDLTGQTYKLREWQNDHPEKMHVVQSQISARLHSPRELAEGHIDDIVE